MLRSNSQWRVSDTANELGYSTSTMSEYLTVAEWLKTYPKLENYKLLTDAIDFIRTKKKELRLL